MKVLLINNCHYYRGGAETAYFGIGEMLENKGHEVVYLSFYDEQNIQTKGKGYFVKKRGGFSAVADYFSNNNAAGEIDLLIKRERPDIPPNEAPITGTPKVYASTIVIGLFS